MKKSRGVDSKVKELKKLLGLFIRVQLNDVKLFEKMPELHSIGISPVFENYLVGVTKNFIYLGPKTDTYSELIHLDSISVISIIDPADSMAASIEAMRKPGDKEH